MFCRWRSLKNSDFVEEQTEFGDQWFPKYPTQKAGDIYRVGLFGGVIIADIYFFGGFFSLAGKAAAILWSEIEKQKAARQEAEIQCGLDQSLKSSVWQVEPENDFAMRVRDIMPGHGPEGLRPLNRLLKAWLADCDEHHGCSHPNPSYTPLRLIDTRPDNLSTNELVLVEHIQCSDYVVLSHSWGTGMLTREEQDQFCTNVSNIDQRLIGFDLDDLPQSFQDAVTVTRAIGKRYLWIDSVCLIQSKQVKPDREKEIRSKEDKAVGLTQMDQVFASAYCTIAASSATNMKQGFLAGHQVPNASGSRTDFEQDVNQSHSNKRTWVLQERVLSCRTIHFTSEHVYWECGEFARCDNYTKLTSAPGRDYFVQDPHFPERLSWAGIPRIVGFLEWLIHDYSKRGITDEYDRYYAISALITRMKTNRAFGVHGQYGVFDFCLPRLLLWRRVGSSGPPINYTTTDIKSVPSWSWMTYPGEVKFMAGATEKLNVAVGNDLWMKDGGRQLGVNVRSLVACRAVACQNGRASLYESESGSYIGELWADQEMYARVESCVVVGYDKNQALSSNPMMYVIFVQKARAGGKLTRLGVGTVKANSIYGSGTRGVLE